MSSHQHFPENATQNSNSNPISSPQQPHSVFSARAARSVGNQAVSPGLHVKIRQTSQMDATLSSKRCEILSAMHLREAAHPMCMSEFLKTRDSKETANSYAKHFRGKFNGN